MEIEDCIPGTKVKLDKMLHYAEQTDTAVINKTQSNGLVVVELDAKNIGRVKMKVNPKYLTKIGGS